MLTNELQRSLRAASHAAARQHHEYITLEHILHALLDDPTSKDVIHHCGGDIAQLRHALEAFMAEHLQPLPAGVQAAPEPTAAVPDFAAATTVLAASSPQTVPPAGFLAASSENTMKATRDGRRK